MMHRLPPNAYLHGENFGPGSTFRNKPLVLFVCDPANKTFDDLKYFLEQGNPINIETDLDYARERLSRKPLDFAAMIFKLTPEMLGNCEKEIEYFMNAIRREGRDVPIVLVMPKDHWVDPQLASLQYTQVSDDITPERLYSLVDSLMQQKHKSSSVAV